MSGQKKHSLAAGEGAFEILETVVHHNFADVLPRVLGKQAHFGQLTAERSKHTSQDAGALTGAFFRKYQFQIAPADVPQADVQQVKGPGKNDGCRSRQRTGQSAY